MSRRISPYIAAVPLAATLLAGCAGALDASGRSGPAGSSVPAAATAPSGVPATGQDECGAIVRRFAAALAQPLGLVHGPLPSDDHLPAPVRADVDTVAGAYARATHERSLQALLSDPVWAAVQRIDALAHRCG